MPCVLTTSVMIKDEVAASFPYYIYGSLARGETIASAFDQACAAILVRFSRKGPLSSMVRDLCRDSEMSSYPESLDSLWSLHGAESATQLRLISAPGIRTPAPA